MLTQRYPREHSNTVILVAVNGSQQPGMKPAVRRQYQNNFTKDSLKMEVEMFNEAVSRVAGQDPYSMV